MSYPPPQQPPPQRPVGPRLKFWTSGPGILILFAIAGVVIGGIAAVTRLVEGPPSKNFDVTVVKCSSGSVLDSAVVGFTITNNSDQVRSATVKVEYRDGDGNRLDTDTTYVPNIAPGDTVRKEEGTMLDADPEGAITCRIVGIS